MLWVLLPGVKSLNNAPKSLTYSLRISSRARHVKLAVKPYQGLEIVIPKRFPKNQIPHILQQHQAWITSQLDIHRQSFEKTALPKVVDLQLVNKSVSIDYIFDQDCCYIESDRQLLIHHQHEQQAVHLLRKWIRLKAKQLLPPLLDDFADEFGFCYKKVSIRSQKTRWGSCSGSGTISLNDQLLFMPAATVRYLMIHELCHTRFMNHSTEFWSLVESCQADYRIQHKLLENGHRYVPGWFSASLFNKGNQRT